MPKIFLRRDTQHDWNRANPILGVGEPGYETDTHRLKIGDGDSRWTDLPYFVPGRFSNPDEVALSEQDLLDHMNAELPHTAYDEGPSLALLYNNAKV